MPKHADLEKCSRNGDGWDLNETGVKTPRRGGAGVGEECRLYSVNMNMGLDYLKPRWIILFCWLLKLAESGPMLPQVCPILQRILCSRHWIHDPLLLKAGLGPLSAYGSFDTLCDGLSMPVRCLLGKPLAGYPVGAHGAIVWLLPQGQVTAWLQLIYIASNTATNKLMSVFVLATSSFPYLALSLHLPNYLPQNNIVISKKKNTD